MMLEVECGDMRSVLAALPENAFDSCCTDPPYGLNFMAKGWDRSNVETDPETWAHVLRVLKPGAYLVAFGGTRTWHRIACAIEDAGFEIRDNLAWLQAQGFPKSLDVQRAAMIRSGVCLSKETVRHVALTSKLFQVKSNEAKQSFAAASAVILPEGEAALVLGIGRADVSSGLMAMSLSGLAEKTCSNIDSLWSASSAAFSEPTRTSITRTEIERITGSKILSSVLEARISQSTTQSKETNQHGCKCPVASVVSFSTDGKLSFAPIPVRSAHDGVTSREQIERLDGTGSAMKPCFEPVILARKPLIGTVADNVLAYGVGGLHIDACRTPAEKPTGWGGGGGSALYEGGLSRIGGEARPVDGRWPPNVLCDEEVAADLDERFGTHKAGKSVTRNGGGGKIFDKGGFDGPRPDSGYSDSGGVSRYFYCPKANAKERDLGLEAWPVLTGGEATDRVDGTAGVNNPRAGAGRTGGRRNPHPTVKPIELMRWLVRLVTPPGGFVLDPFAGSGTTGCACALEGFHFAGVELDPVHVRLAMDRIAYWASQRPVS
jgi:DNA modification methylase